MEDRSKEVARVPSAHETGLRSRIAWGLVDQGASSVTNFGLSVLAARLLGPSGLGVVAIGFSAYLIILGFERALLAEPAVIVSSAKSQAARDGINRSVVAATVMFGCLGALALLSVGFSVGGRIGRGLILFAPWLMPALLQDLWRMLLFRDGRGFAAASNDGFWLIGMLLGLPLAWNVRTDWAIVAWWGLGATCGAIGGFIQLRTRGESPRDAWLWAKREAWPLGRWFAAEGAVYTAATQFVVFVVGGLLGTQAVGGLRSVQILFAPFALLGPAIALPGLPSIAGALQRSTEGAWRLALKLTAVLAVLAVGYLLASLAAGERLLSVLLGRNFVRYGQLISPLGVQQVLYASSSGFFLLLKAARRGRALLFYRSVVSLSTIVAVIVLAVPFRLLGAAWGLTSGTAIGSLLLLMLCWPRRREDDA